MSGSRIRVDQLASTILKELEGYNEEIGAKTKEVIMKEGKEGAQQVKAASPKRHSSGGKPGTYAKGWRFKVVSESVDSIEAVIHNATNPGLPHLLEFGHALRQGGRSPARVHIAPIEQSVTEKIEQEIERIAQ